MKRVVRIIFLIVGIPLAIIFPITVAFIVLWLMYIMIMGPLAALYYWANNNHYELRNEKENIVMGWLMPLEIFKWAWYGDTAQQSHSDT